MGCQIGSKFKHTQVPTPHPPLDGKIEKDTKRLTGVEPQGRPAIPSVVYTPLWRKTREFGATRFGKNPPPLVTTSANLLVAPSRKWRYHRLLVELAFTIYYPFRAYLFEAWLFSIFTLRQVWAREFLCV